MEKFEFEITENEVGVRLDKALADKFFPLKPEITRSKIQHLIDENQVFDEKNKPITTASQKTKLGQKISVIIPDPRPSHLEAREIPFEIVFEDDDSACLCMINCLVTGNPVYPRSRNNPI